METTRNPERRNKASVVSLIAGILTTIFSCAGYYSANNLPRLPTIIIGIGIGCVTAVTTGIISLWQIKKSGEVGKRGAIAGIILGALPTLLYLLLLLYIFSPLIYIR